MPDVHLKVKHFTQIFRPLLIVYALLFFIRLDWSFYDTYAPSLYKPVGLFSLLNIQWPGLTAIYVLIGMGALSGLVALIGIERKWSLYFFGAILFLLDGFHNMFGFINAQIHLIFFTFALAAMETAPDKPLFDSKPFHFCETVLILVYFQSGLSKILDSGLAWGLDGGTLQIGLLRQNTSMGLLLASSSTLSIALAISTLAFELLFPLLYLVNGRRLPIYLLSAGFHIGTLLFMGIDFFHLWVFSLTMIILLLRSKGRYAVNSQTAAA